MTGIAPLLVLLLLPVTAPRPAMHRATSYGPLLHSLILDAHWDAPPTQAGLGDAAPAFDTRSLRLVPTDSTRRMNVVFVVLEAVRARSTTPYDTTLATTPFLDALARRSLLVEDMYAVVPYTNKAMTALFGGIYPYPHRAMREAQAAAGQGLPALLRSHGYRSAFFTPARLDFERKDRILQNLGFEEVYGGGDYATDGYARTNYFGHEDRVVMPDLLRWVELAQISRPGSRARDRHRDGAADGVADGRMSAREIEQSIELVVIAVGLDIHQYPDGLVTGRHRFVEPEQPLQIDPADELRRKPLDADAASRSVQHRRRRHAAGERMQQKLDRVRALVVAEQYRRLAVRELEILAP